MEVLAQYAACERCAEVESAWIDLGPFCILIEHPGHLGGIRGFRPELKRLALSAEQLPCLAKVDGFDEGGVVFCEDTGLRWGGRPEQGRADDACSWGAITDDRDPQYGAQLSACPAVVPARGKGAIEWRSTYIGAFFWAARLVDWERLHLDAEFGKVRFCP